MEEQLIVCQQNWLEMSVFFPSGDIGSDFPLDMNLTFPIYIYIFFFIMGWVSYGFKCTKLQSDYNFGHFLQLNNIVLLTIIRTPVLHYIYNIFRCSIVYCFNFWFIVCCFFYPMQVFSRTNIFSLIFICGIFHVMYLNFTCVNNGKKAVWSPQQKIQLSSSLVSIKLQLWLS